MKSKRPGRQSALRGNQIGLAAASLIWLATSVATADISWEAQWPHWRGPRGNGFAPAANPPLTWSSRDNVAWKRAIPGEGSATPIVWGDRIFVISAVPTDRTTDSPTTPHPDSRTRPPNTFYRFVVLCIDRTSGEMIWQRVAAELVPHEGRHSTNTYASGSPTTDGKRLYVSFGSAGIFCYDLDGNKLWQRDLGNLRTRRGWGEAVTPVVHDDWLLINWDQEENSAVVALNAATGETRWQVARDEKTSWNTPLVVPYGPDEFQVILNGTNRVRSYQLSTGRTLWSCGGQTVNAIPSPIRHQDVVLCMSGYRGAAAMAIPLTASGDVTDAGVARWAYGADTPYVPSPIVLGNQVYFTKANRGILTSLDVNSGRVVFGPVRLNGIGNMYASPAATEDRIYWVGRDGTTTVIKPGAQLEVLATNRIDEPVDASPVLVGRQLLLRTNQHLYCFKEN